MVPVDWKKARVTPVYKGSGSKDDCGGVTLAQLVKASVGQADVRRFEPHLGHN